MAIMETNWRSFLSPGSDLPPDVHFLVITQDGEKSIGAHKLLMAGVSPVFRVMLCGPMKETGNVIRVEETSHEAFSSMISFIYKVPGEGFHLNDVGCPQKLFDLLAVADKYEILSLKTLTLDTLGSLAIANESVISFSTVAYNYKLLFEDVSQKLLMRCLKFLLDTTAGGCAALISEAKKKFPDANSDVLEGLLHVGSESLQLPGALKILCKMIFLICDVQLRFAGWGNLVNFDTEEHEMTKVVLMAKIAKLADEWKISYDIYLVEYLVGYDFSGYISLWMEIQSPSDPDDYFTLNAHDVLILKSDQLPKLHEWTRVEISHVEESGKYFLSLSVGGEELARKECEMGRNLTDVNIYCVCLPNVFQCQPCFIRGLLVLDKH